MTPRPYYTNGRTRTNGAGIGGLLMATLFTLFFVPCVYAIVYDQRTTEQKGRVSL
jgi:hypothetical protein